MTDPKFTPGPWKVCRSNEDFDGPLYMLDDDDYKRPINAIRSKSETVACAHDLFEFDEANAHLIAAAPELYEALLGVETRCADGYVGQDGQYLKVIKAALAKARGREP